MSTATGNYGLFYAPGTSVAPGPGQITVASGSSFSIYTTLAAAVAGMNTMRGNIKALTSLVYNAGTVTATYPADSTITTGDVVLVRGSSIVEDNVYQTVTVVNSTSFTFSSSTSGTRTLTSGTYSDVNTTPQAVITLGEGSFPQNSKLFLGDNVTYVGTGFNGSTLITTNSTTVVPLNAGTNNLYINIQFVRTTAYANKGGIIGCNMELGDAPGTNVIFQYCWWTSVTYGTVVESNSAFQPPLITYTFIDCVAVCGVTTWYINNTYLGGGQFHVMNLIGSVSKAIQLNPSANAATQGVGCFGSGITMNIVTGIVLAQGITGSSQSVQALSMTGSGSTLTLCGVNTSVASGGGSGSLCSLFMNDPAALSAAFTVTFIGNGTGFDPTLVNIDDTYANAHQITGLPPRSPYVIQQFSSPVQLTNNSEDNLFTYTTPYNTLMMNGDVLEFDAWGTLSSTATATKVLRVYFAGTKIYDSGTLTSTAAGAWQLSAKITVTSIGSGPGSVTCDAIASISVSGANLPAAQTYTALTGLTLSGGPATTVTGGTNIIKVTGQNGGSGTANTDIIAKSGQVLIRPGA